MLIGTNTTPQSNEVITFKLVSGEEMIGRLHEDNVDHMIVIKPLCLVPSPNGQGLGLAPAVFSIDPQEKVRVNKSAIAMQARTVQEIANQYIQQTTGLAIAKTL